MTFCKNFVFSCKAHRFHRLLLCWQSRLDRFVNCKAHLNRRSFRRKRAIVCSHPWCNDLRANLRISLFSSLEDQFILAALFSCMESNQGLFAMLVLEIQISAANFLVEAELDAISPLVYLLLSELCADEQVT